MSSLRGAGVSSGAVRTSAITRAGSNNHGGYKFNAVTLRPAVLGLAKLLFLPLASAAPLLTRGLHAFEGGEDDLPKSADSPDLWAYLGVAVALVLLGGAFAGLTIALMGQDETYLQVIATSGEGAERKHAQKVLNLLGKGKHWVLVTLLLSNVITNETLPIVLDRSLGGGWPAVVSSTVLIVIFGEIAPQSVCVRYGLSIGAFMAPCVLALMWILAPIAWPTAKLLDYLLGEDHGTMYNKPGLKTLVQLHKSLGTTPGDRLLEDEVTIINSVLDLKDKPVGDIMTPMGDVFTMSANTVLDERMMEMILSQGYSRIPVYAPENHRNFVGMLLVKMLITYDPEDCKRVRDFALATLPETGPYTSCLDIINFFQEGKSHMVMVSDFPGQDKGALGVVTLEDVIEELIGEEIIDESDVFVDVHKAIRRIAPAPRQKYSKLFSAESDNEATAGEDTPLLGAKDADVQSSRKPSFGQTTLLMRRKSSNASESTRDTVKQVPIRPGTQDFRKHLSHLGPSNVASKPRTTKFTSVKIKPGVGTIPEGQATTVGDDASDARARSASESMATAPIGGGEGAGLLKDAGKDASDGAEALAAGYGTMHSPTRSRSRRRSDEQEIHAEGGSEEPTKLTPAEASKQAEQHVQTPPGGDSRADGEFDYVANGTTNGDQDLSSAQDAVQINEPPKDEQPTTPKSARSPKDLARLSPGGSKYGNKLVIGPAHDADNDDDDQVGDMPPSRDRSKNRRTARSGSITETEIHVNGMKKMVLETTSSSDGEDGSSSPKQTVTSGKQVVTPPVELETATDGRAEELAQSEGDLMGSGNTSSTNSGGAAGGAKKKNKKKKKKAKKAGE